MTNSIADKRKYRKSRYGKQTTTKGSDIKLETGKRRRVIQSAAMEHPTCGFLIMTPMRKEKRGIQELLQLFKTHLSETAVTPKDPNEGSSDVANELDIEAQLAAECDSLRDDIDAFQIVDFETQCVRMITANHPSIQDPSLFMRPLLDDILSAPVEHKRKTSAVSKVIPFQMSCRGNLVDFEVAVKKLCQSVLAGYIEQIKRQPGRDADAKVTIAGLFRRRSHTTITREFALPLLMREACSVSPDLGVDLKNPDLLFIVEIIKNCCCLCISADFYRFSKYNLEMLYQPDSKQPIEE